MKCPNCGSERIQFGTNTSGTGYSAGDACCGFIFLGPLGLLCGACGSDIKTKEFWICQDCGHKFTNAEAQKLQKIEEKAKRNYEQYKLESERALAEYGSKDEIYRLMKKTEAVKDGKIKVFNDYVDQFIEEHFSAPNINKWVKVLDSEYSKLEIGGGIALAILTLMLFIGGAIGLGAFGIFMIIVLVAARPIAMMLCCNKMVKYLVQQDSEIKKLYDAAKAADEENEKYSTIISKMDSCEEYERNKR